MLASELVWGDWLVKNKNTEELFILGCSALGLAMLLLCAYRGHIPIAVPDVTACAVPASAQPAVPHRIPPQMSTPRPVPRSLLQYRWRIHTISSHASEEKSHLPRKFWSATGFWGAQPWEEPRAGLRCTFR